MASKHFLKSKIMKEKEKTTYKNGFVETNQNKLRLSIYLCLTLTYLYMVLYYYFGYYD